jgi:hypothetical protein
MHYFFITSNLESIALAAVLYICVYFYALQDKPKRTSIDVENFRFFRVLDKQP